MFPTSGKYLYRLEGRTPVPSKTLEEHLQWELETPHEARMVSKDLVNGVEVSTVFMSHNHNFGDGPPLVFETMVFGGACNHYQARYSTWEEAEKGHARAVAMVMALPGVRTRHERIDDED